MKKEHVAIVILTILLFTVSIAWVLDMQYSKHWVVVGSWVGLEPAVEHEYNLTTYQFSIKGEEWRIHWSCSNYDSYSYWQIVILNASSGNMVDNIERHELYGERSFGFTGTFYLNIMIHGTLENWDISAEDFR
jgi:hypothetical protein